MIVTDISKFDAYRFNLLTHKIKNVKSDYDSDIADQSEYLKGSRYRDDDRIARMVVGYFFAEAGFDYEKANANFLALNSTEILPYIKKAIKESASADYHYTYEKQW
jgi:hypothetical protein